jgi:RHS repeat-associated protein
LLSATVTNSGNLSNAFAYSYDSLGNRLTEQVGASNYTATYNALNQLSTTTTPGASRTNEWDAKDRLVGVNNGNQRIEFTYDGMSRMVSIRQLTNGIEASFRRLVWCDNGISEERDATGAVTKRFFEQGVGLETGPNAGHYYYTRDHLGGIRELTDSSGNVRARYSYDPFGRRHKSTGDLEADFGFTGLFYAGEAELHIARFRAYDPNIGRWLARDPLRMAELEEGPNLYAYVANNPVNAVDPLGLEKSKPSPGPSGDCCEALKDILNSFRNQCSEYKKVAAQNCNWAYDNTPEIANEACEEAIDLANAQCFIAELNVKNFAREYYRCHAKGCDAPKSPCPKPAPRPPPKLPPLYNPITGVTTYLVIAQ